MSDKKHHIVTKAFLKSEIRLLREHVESAKEALKESESGYAELEDELSDLGNAVIPPTDGTWSGIQRLLQIAADCANPGTLERKWIEELIDSQ